jgi:glycosyltransferase involved in cell wall biosynthesis
MKKIKVSIIVPCYNVEEYVEKSIMSLVNQSLKEIEIIAVDDGSKDNTSKILDELASKYNAVKVIHKKNEGVSIARNTALKEAQGEYIGFLDSDDWANENMFEKLYEKAKEEDFDVVVCDTNAIYPDKVVHISCNIREDNVDAKELMLNAYAVIWNKIYKKDVIEGIIFKEHMTFCEDVQFLYMVYSKINSIGVILEPLHNYLQRPGSLTYTYNEKLYQLINSLDDIISYYKKEKKFTTYKSELEYSYVRYLYATFIKRLAKTKNKKEFNRGVKYVIQKVMNEFPDFKKNKYIKTNTPKNIYFKCFNSLTANLIYIVEKNKMN